MSITERAIATPGRVVLEPAHQLLDAFANSRRELGGGGVRERHDEDVGDRQPALDERAHDETGDGPGLAGAGVGLEQMEAGEQRRVEHRVRHRFFAFTTSQSASTRA